MKCYKPNQSNPLIFNEWFTSITIPPVCETCSVVIEPFFTFQFSSLFSFSTLVSITLHFLQGSFFLKGNFQSLQLQCVFSLFFQNFDIVCVKNFLYVIFEGYHFFLFFFFLFFLSSLFSPLLLHICFLLKMNIKANSSTQCSLCHLGL